MRLALAALLAVSLAADAAPATMRPLRSAEELAALLREDAASDRPVVVHFWASWCGQCKEEWTWLPARLAEARARGARILLVSIDDAKGAAAAERVLARARPEGERYRLDAPDPAPVLALFDPAWEASLPATFVFRAGRRTASLIGPATALLEHVPR
jgi:thiol-disulfide isomerase/thioredoxin